ncbi:hypothetical protein [Pelomonas cellulosilytica]|uniref:ABC transporter permease n=1 Tax=Pelomonas cellulosilytica TaxID=2906762 RepID=A0ABS8XSM6_9BURK|nr:hypothetical protein [Pelomonas sp. P8]MCE4553887.1 hypothetical protein [Pelomonas sp. P8]
MNTHIPTLLLREWMQHKRGWLIAALAPPLIFLAILPFGGVQGLPNAPAELVAMAAAAATVAVVYVICLLVALFQLPGLARRDAQDRSIEFWLSLPGRPSESVAATVLAHAWLAPLGGAVIGALFALPVAAGVLTSAQGLGAATAVQWSEVVRAGAPLMLRLIAGTLPLTLWLAPLILVLMAASAWLKRLGVPVVLVGAGVAVAVLHGAYGIDWPLEALQDVNTRINHALFHNPAELIEALRAGGPVGSLMLQDFGLALADLASLQFLAWAAVAAAGFALVVMKRARAG